MTKVDLSRLRGVGAEPQRLETSSKLAASLLPVELLVRVSPYGDVFLDGERIGTNAKRVRVFVSPGRHLLTVINPYSQRHLEQIVLADQDAASEILVRLMPMSSHLVVVTDRAFTAMIGSVVIGHRAKGDLRPLHIPMRSWMGRQLTTVDLVSDDKNKATVTFTAGAGLSTRRHVDFVGRNLTNAR